MLLQIDEYSLATVPIEMYFGQQRLGIATAFLWRTAGPHFLITNWHNVTGRNPLTGQCLSSHGGVPDNIKVYFCEPAPSTSRQTMHYPLYAADNKPNWLVHSVHKHRVDVVAIPIKVPDRASAYPINSMQSDNLELRIGMDVFILGYPFGLGVTALPTWKRGSVASEPNMIVDQQLHALLDTASRPGMSGSPVIRRSWGTHMMQGNSMLAGKVAATRFVGIYSGRVGLDERDIQLGIMWPAQHVQEIVSEGVRGEAP